MTNLNLLKLSWKDRIELRRLQELLRSGVISREGHDLIIDKIARLIKPKI